ncbi:MAG: efflux RND transporter periplasmic adaptor subunit, partial [Dehalococcoidia bacterium]|nr:efflux RND transporter periplasmic adaptor subunit [Dehalococcoidia bacterium]
MLSSPKKFLLTLLTSVTLLAISGCSAASSAGTATTISRQVPVTRGDLVMSVSVDGNLEMTDYYNLRFASTGEVKKVLVEEGDQVKQGQLLAYLDDTTAQLDVKAANNAVQSSLSTMYETVPRLPQFPTSYYNASSVTTTTTSPLTTTQVMYLDGETIPPAPPAIVTTITGNNPGTVTTTITTTTVTTTPGPYVVVTPGPTTIPTIIPPGTTTIGAIPTTIVTTQIQTQKTSTTTTWAAPEGVHNDISYQMYYPNATILSSYLWAQEEVAGAYGLFQNDDFISAASELYVASADLEACIKILEDAITNPESGLGNTA